MPRRSWRDFDDAAANDTAPAAPVAVPAAASASGDLERAARLVPDSRLGELMEQRRALEDRLRNLTGLPGQQGSGDAARDARFRVPSFAERQAEIRAWEARRRQQVQRRTKEAWPASNRWTPDAGGDAPPALSEPATNLGATGLLDRLQGLRASTLGRSREVRERLLAGPRSAARRAEDVARPVTQLGDQLTGQQRDLDEMDRRLAAEGVDARERAEIRDAVGGKSMDKVAGVLGRASQAIEAPKKAVAKIERFWEHKERQISGPMDRFSNYSAERDRRLSTERGGSGDLFERMQANRRRALERRRESQLQERRDERRRQRARERATQRREGDDRP